MEPEAIVNLALTVLGNPAFGAGAQAWAESVASTLISGLWQGALVACGLALCLRIAPGCPPGFAMESGPLDSRPCCVCPFCPCSSSGSRHPA